MSDITTQAVETAAKALEDQLSLLGPDERLAMKPVVDLLLKDRTVPASTRKSNHGAFPGGLIVHTHRVWRILVGMSKGALDASYDYLNHTHPLVNDPAVLAEERKAVTEASMFKVAVIHDLNKIQDVSGCPHYVPNILKSGSRSEAVPWEVNKESGLLQSVHKSALVELGLWTKPPGWWLDVLHGEGIQVRDGLLSIAVAKGVSPTLNLTPQERNAIIYHDGAYAGRQGLQDSESLLQILLHASDLICARLLC